MKVQQIPYEEYAAIIEAGGKAFAFYIPEDGHENREWNDAHATMVMSGGRFDEYPDRRRDIGQVCYTEVE
jgi:hypothetical protein